METRKALITGITGQDGRLLTKLLLSKGYEVTGIVRKVVGRDNSVIPDGVEIIYADITDFHSLSRQLDIPGFIFDEVYHLAAQSDVAYSFEHPKETYDINIGGTLNLLNSLHLPGKIYFAGTSELYGQPMMKPQDEDYPMRPRSPYAVSKLSGYWTCRNYREAYGDFISCGILFNHESEIRGTNFVTRKITSSIARFLRDGTPFSLGNLDARKDWGYAPDYVEGMWMILQQDEADDFVLATNEQHTVKEFLEMSLQIAGIQFSVSSDDSNRIVYTDDSGKTIVNSSFDLYRPAEADNYQGDYTKANRRFGWKPKIGFAELVKRMTENDIRLGYAHLI